MSQPTTRKYPAEFKQRAVKLAVESDQPIAQTARDLGVHENTLHTWLGKYHRVEHREKELHDEHLYEELKRLRKENACLKEEREILPQRPSPNSCREGRLDTRAAFRVFRQEFMSGPRGLAQRLRRVVWTPAARSN
jgi:transposase